MCLNGIKIVLHSAVTDFSQTFEMIEYNYSSNTFVEILRISKIIIRRTSL